MRKKGFSVPLLSLALSLSLLHLSSCGWVELLEPPPSVPGLEAPGESETPMPRARLQRLSDESGQEDAEDDSRVVSATYQVSPPADYISGDLLIALPIAAQHLPADFETFQLQPEYFDEASQSWVPSGAFPEYDASSRTLYFSDYVPASVFRAQQAATARKYRVRSALFSNILTAHREGSHFRIHYYPAHLASRHKVFKDADWGRPGLSDHPEVPDFIEDLDAALNEVYAELLKVSHSQGRVFQPLAVQDVYVQNTGTAAGNSTLGGPLYISNSRIENLHDLKLTAAHELVHVFQGQYYGVKGLWTGRQNRAFIEATANYYAARVCKITEASKARFFADMASQYLSVPLSQNNENSMYAAGHFFDWLSQQYGDTLMGEALRRSSGNDWTALSRAIAAAKSGDTLGSAYEAYLAAILTRPEDTDNFHKLVRGQLANAAMRLAQPNNLLSDKQTYFRFKQSLPPYTSALPWMYFNNTDDALLVMDARLSQGALLKSLSYTEESDQNAPYLNWQPLETYGLQPVVGKASVIEHVGRAQTRRQLNQLFSNSSAATTAQVDVRYYLLRPPVIRDSGESYLYWRLDTLGNLPREVIKGFNVYYKDTARRWQLLAQHIPVAWGQAEQRYALKTPVQGHLSPPEFLVTISDQLGHQWPKVVQDTAKMTLSVQGLGEDFVDHTFLDFGARVMLKAEPEGLEDTRVKWEVIRRNPLTCGDEEAYCRGPLGSLSVNGLSAVYAAPGDYALHTVRVSSLSRPEVYAEVSMRTTGGFCLAPGTDVTLANGQRRPIESLKRGDKVQGWDEASGQVIEATIEGVLSHRQPSLLYQVQAADGDVIRVTGNHPVYTREAGWIPVENLKPGMTLLQVDRGDGRFTENRLIGIIRESSETAVVYNLKTTTGNYFANDLLVHNKCLAPGSLIETPDGPRAVERLLPGDAVWTRIEGQRVLTRVTHVYQKDTILPSLPGKILAPGQVVTHNHRIWHAGCWQRAGETDLPDTRIVGPVYDLATAAGTYLAAGVLMGEPENIKNTV